jgi:hypothetical protein
MIPFIQEYRKFRQSVREEIGDVREDDILLLFGLYLDRRPINPFSGLESIMQHLSPFMQQDPDDESNNDDPFSNSSGSGAV